MISKATPVMNIVHSNPAPFLNHVSKLSLFGTSFSIL